MVTQDTQLVLTTQQDGKKVIEPEKEIEIKSSPYSMNFMPFRRIKRNNWQDVIKSRTIIWFYLMLTLRKENSPRILQAHCAKAPQAQAQTKALSKSLQSQGKEKLFLKNFLTLQKNKKCNAQPDTTMTLKLKNDNGLQGRTTRTTGYNKQIGNKAGEVLLSSFCKRLTSCYSIEILC